MSSNPLAAPRWVFCVLAVFAWSGCGPNDGLEPRLPVSGMVTYKGEPVPQGSINFEPEDPAGRPATGLIEDGRFRLTTLTPGDGAIPGRYKVAITSREVIDTSEVAAEAEGGAYEQLSLAAAEDEAESLIPPRYALSSTSGLTAEVARGSTSFDFELVD